MSLTDRVKEKAHALGFDLVGIAPVQRATHADAYASWVEAGYAAQMGYMVRDVERRQNPQLVLPGAQSVVVVGLSYYQGDCPEVLWNDPSRGRIARYAWGSDYHETMTPRLGDLAEFIAGELRQDVALRVYVDTGPVLERDAAALAGLGFIGRNTNLISPLYGSFLFLGEILVATQLDYDQPAVQEGAEITWRRPAAAADRGQTQPAPAGCGQCRRCLAACPTGALTAAYVLDSRRCISYLTIELKGSIPETIRPQMGNWIFGCDACQSVCPWPRRYARSAAIKAPDVDPERVAPRLLDLITLSESQFRQRFRNTPLWRSKRRGLLRNVAVALGNWGSQAALPALRRAAQDSEPLVREHAAWALEQIRNKGE